MPLALPLLGASLFTKKDVPFEHTRFIDKLPHTKCAFPYKINRCIHQMHLRLIYINYVAQRAYTRLNLLKGKVEPAALVVYMKALINGWVTAKRMRTINGTSVYNLPKCYLCHGGQDSLEHLACCKEVKSIFSRGGSPITCSLEFFGLHDRCTVAKNLARHVRVMAVVYSVYNALSHHPVSLPPFPMRDLISTAFQCMFAQGSGYM